MKGGLSQLMKQAQKMQEQMQENLQKAQEELDHLQVTGQAGGGMVEISMTGRYDVRKVHLDDQLLQDDKEMLEDLIAAAMNDAVRKVEKLRSEKMSGMAGDMGLNLPGGMKLPF